MLINILPFIHQAMIHLTYVSTIITDLANRTVFGLYIHLNDVWSDETRGRITSTSSIKNKL
jgi:hypothetical protein